METCLCHGEINRPNNKESGRNKASDETSRGFFFNDFFKITIKCGLRGSKTVFLLYYFLKMSSFPVIFHTASQFDASFAIFKAH